MGGHAPGGQILEVTKCERDIGVLISNDLKPSLQCASAAQKANQLLGRMSGPSPTETSIQGQALQSICTTSSIVLCSGLVTLA